MQMSVRTEEGICIISVQEARIDAAVALEFKEDVRRHAKTAPPHVVLDLTEVTFIDSSGLGAIVVTMKYLAPDQKLILAGLTPAVDRVFKLTRMESVFEIFLTLEEALNAEHV